MRIELSATEADEKQRYSERGGAVRVDRAVGGVLIAFGPGMPVPEIHQWGPVPECLAAMKSLEAQLWMSGVVEASRREVQRILKIQQDAKAMAWGRRAVGGDGNDGKIVVP